MKKLSLMVRLDSHLKTWLKTKTEQQNQETNKVFTFNFYVAYKNVFSCSTDEKRSSADNYSENCMHLIIILELQYLLNIDIHFWAKSSLKFI